MSLLPSRSLGSEAPESDPRVREAVADRPEIQALFELALEGSLPRSRELKPWEPQRLNERHLAMVSMRATGVQQRIIAQAFGATDSNVSIVLNHPDAEYLLSRLQAMKATRTSDIEVRLQALAGKAIGALEAVFEDDVEPEERRLAFKRTPAAFKVLDMNGYARRQPVEHKHEHSHRLEASPAELGELAAALRESRQIAVQEAHVVSSGPLAPVGPGGEPATSPSTALSGKADAGAPSISDSQDPAREGGQA